MTNPHKELNEIEASKLSDIEFKVMVIRIVKELKENYIIMKKDIKSTNKNQLEMKTEISEMKDTLEEIKGRLNEADDQISIMEYKVKKCSIREIKRKKKDGLRELWDNMKDNNICIIEIPEGEEREQGIENLFE